MSACWDCPESHARVTRSSSVEASTGLRLHVSVSGLVYHDTMRITTAAELERMSPAERDAHFEASIITDLDAAPHGVKALVERARRRHTARSQQA